MICYINDITVLHFLLLFILWNSEKQERNNLSNLVSNMPTRSDRSVLFALFLFLCLYMYMAISSSADLHPITNVQKICDSYNLIVENSLSEIIL